MKLFRQLRSAAEQATDEIRREFEAAAHEIESAKQELVGAVDEVRTFGAETKALVDEAQRGAMEGGSGADATTAPREVDQADIGTILPPDMAAMVAVHAAVAAGDDDIDPAEHAIQAMGGGARQGDDGVASGDVAAGSAVDAGRNDAPDPARVDPPAADPTEDPR